MRVSGKARVAGVIGWPVGHSKSPLLHGWWLDRLGIDGAYVPLPVRPDDLAGALSALARLGFVGVNLTVPHKQAALAIVDEIEPVARRIGAVNTVVIGADGRLAGRNTDAFGFLRHLEESVPRFLPASGPAVVLGAGGAARAVAAALVDAGVPEVRVVCRGDEQGRALAESIGGPVRVVPWREAPEALRGAAVLVNATFLGMTGQAPLELALDPLPGDAVVDDIVYAPLETDLLARARRRGNPVVDGLGMLIHQARPAFAAFFGPMPEATPELRAMLLAA